MIQALKGEHIDLYLSAKTIKIVTDLSGKIIFANLSAISLTGYSSEELLRTHSRAFRPHMFAPTEHYNNLWSSLREHGVWHGILGMRKRDGGVIWTKGVVYTIFDEDGEPVAYCGKRIICSKYEVGEHYLEIAKMCYNLL